jgi:hypothetical protein
MWKSLVPIESYPAFSGVQGFKFCELKSAIFIAPFNFEIIIKKHVIYK